MRGAWGLRRVVQSTSALANAATARRRASPPPHEQARLPPGTPEVARGIVEPLAKDVLDHLAEDIQLGFPLSDDLHPT